MSKKEEASPQEKVSIRPNVENYESVTSASGTKSMHNGDEVASALQEIDIHGVRHVVQEVGIVDDKTPLDKYDHLNVGQQRMNWGNRIRAFVKKDDGNMAKLKKAIKGAPAPVKITKSKKAKAPAAEAA